MENSNCTEDVGCKACLAASQLGKTLAEHIWGFPEIKGYHFRGPHNKGYSILGSILGFPIWGKYHV